MTPAEVFPEAPLPYLRQRGTVGQAVLWVVTLALVTLLLITAGRMLHDPNAGQLRRYQGVEWKGDTCYVDDTGVLWCEGGGPQ